MYRGRGILSRFMMKIASNDVMIDACKAGDIGNRNPLVYLVHRLADEAELDHGAVIFDKACIRSAARRGQLGIDARDFLDRLCHHIDQIAAPMGTM